MRSSLKLHKLAKGWLNCYKAKPEPEQLVSLVETSLKIEYNTCSLWAVPMTRLIFPDPADGYGESCRDRR